MFFLIPVIICDIVKIKMDGSDEYLVVAGRSLVVADFQKFYTFDRRPSEDGSGTVSLKCGDTEDFLSFDPYTGLLISEIRGGLSYSRFMFVEIGRGRYKIMNGDRCVMRNSKNVIHLTECYNSPHQVFNIYGTIAEDIHDVGGRFSHHHHVHHVEYVNLGHNHHHAHNHEDNHHHHHVHNHHVHNHNTDQYEDSCVGVYCHGLSHSFSDHHHPLNFSTYSS